MKRLVMLTMVLLILSVAVLQAQVITKVAILPIKAYDSNSRYIQKILTKRDLKLAFDTHQQYALLDMKTVERQFKQTGFRDVEGLELAEMDEVANTLGADLLIMGNVRAENPVTFRVTMRLFSPKSKELREIGFSVTKQREARQQVLNDTFVAEIDRFISNEVQKMLNIASNFYAQGNYPDAERTLTTVIALNGELKEAHYTLGATYFKTNRNELAVSSLNKALELDPTYDAALYTLVDVYEAMNQPMQRIAILSRIAEKNQDEELWFNIGNLYAENGDNPRAVESFRKALVIQPTYSLAQYRLAFLLYDLGQYNDAIEYLEFAYNQYPDNDLIARRLALAYQRSGRIDDAIARYESAITANPNNAQAYLNIVSLYRIKASEATDTAISTEMNNKAINTMNRLKAVDPNNALAYLNLASIYLAQSKFTEAESNANQTIAKDPSLYLPYLILSTIAQTNGTNAYNRFVDLEQRASQAVGSRANTLRRDRDAAKNQANTQFRRALDQLQNAKSRTNEAEILNDINNRITRVQALINSTSGY